MAFDLDATDDLVDCARRLSSRASGDVPRVSIGTPNVPKGTLETSGVIPRVT
jgi:hypothetical protein